MWWAYDSWQCPSHRLCLPFGSISSAPFASKPRAPTEAKANAFHSIPAKSNPSLLTSRCTLKSMRAKNRLEHHAVRQLVDEAALDLLPRSLALRIRVAARLRERFASLCELCIRNEHVGGSLAEVDSDPVAGLEQCEAAAGCGLRGGVEDRRAAGGARLAPVADARQLSDTALQEVVRRAHVDHLGRARIADRPDAANDEHGVVVELERRIVDARVVVLRAVEDHRAALESIRIERVRRDSARETRPRSPRSS